ncbi:LAME_0F08658g1_1 [Lachancea meyersii CBS 8951]|uniref:Actin cytoskeleton-regulatory complex protein PAN1 n=1 Tax=Lachancea meyersii CBS 8951 TaxID=1266667 RepID=A0A1G4JUP0_9SACH|nr:LAME_0F08658g1_1 [Lachancea meyersii CBS 8951]
MFNPYQVQGPDQAQNQGNVFNQQASGFYPGGGQQQQQQQQPPPLNQRPTTEFGNLQQNVPASFGFQQQPQQQQSLPNYSNNRPMYSSATGFGGMQTGFEGNQPQNQSMGNNSVQPQSTGFYSQQNTLQLQQTGQFAQQVPRTSFFNNQNPNQSQTTFSQQQQNTGLFQQPVASQQSAPLQYQRASFPDQHASQTQSTGYYPQQQPQQQIQPQATGFLYHQQMSSPSQPLQAQQTNLYPQQAQPVQPQQTGFYSQQALKPLQPQQTGFYSQNFQEPVKPLKPNATGFVNSFANNGVNDDIKIPTMRLSFMTANDQAKFETLFRSSVPRGSNTISGDACRNILMRSGVSPSQLAKIWTLCDTSKAGELLFPEFALAMHLVNEVIQGDSVPFELSTKTKNEVASFVDAINFSIARSGEESVAQPPKTPFDNLTLGVQNLQPQPTGAMPQTSFGSQLQAQNTQGYLDPQSTGYLPQTSFGQILQSQPTGGYLQNQFTGQFQQPASTGQLQGQSTGGYLQPQTTGFMPQTSFNQPLQSQLTGIATLQPQNTGSLNRLNSVLTGQPPAQQSGQANFAGASFLQSQATGYLPPSNFNPTAPLSAQKTGYGRNELYNQANMFNKFTQDDSDSLTNEEKSLFYKMFDTYDSQKKGLMGSDIAVEIFRKSGLNRSDLEHIWNLCDTNNSGQLNKQEFALGMHLVYRRLNGNELPNRLPTSLVPSSTQILNSVKSQLKNDTASSRKEPTKIDGFSFKHDDNEILPSSRNRRRTQTGKAGASGDSASAVSAAASKEPEQSFHSSQSAGRNDGRAIEDLKRKILALPPHRSASRNDTNEVSAQLRGKFQVLTSKVPQLLREISEINNQITMAKIELYRQRNPSSLVGTGRNGEITDDDRRKAKSKALLASRMAALTGKPSVGADVDQQEQRYNEEVASIKSQNTTNQSIIEDIQLSIFEIAAAVDSALEGKARTSGKQYEKWELGIGVDPQVSNFLSKLKPKVSSPPGSHAKSSNAKAASSSSFADSPSAPVQSPHSTSGNTAAYLKEQAQRKMKERLAKLGMEKNDPEPAQRKYNPEELDRSEEDEEVRKLTEQLNALKAKRKGGNTNAPPSQLSVSPVPAPNVQTAYPSKVDIQPEIEPSRDSTMMADERNKHLENVTPATEPTSRVTHESVPSKTAESIPKEAVSSQPASSNAKRNPFGIPHTASVSSTPTGGRNPFFKPSQSSTSSFDAKAAEAQRRVQRGLDNNDDDWSDDNDDHEKSNAHAQAPSVPAPAPVATAPVTSTPVAPAPAAPTLVAPAPVAPAPVAPAPVAPAIADAPPVPIAPPLPQVVSNPATYAPPVPIAPPLPSIGSIPTSGAAETPGLSSNALHEGAGDDGERSDDDLSIPDSVDSFNDALPVQQEGSVPPSGIPPPPALT